MNFESYDWNDLYKKAEKFMRKYIPEAVVNVNTRTIWGEHLVVEVRFPEKRNKTVLENLNKEKCFRRLRGSNVNGARIGRGQIIFNADGSLYK